MAIKDLMKKMLNFFRKKQIVYVKDVVRPYEISLIEKNRFSGQVAVVTGGSGVIGRAIAFRLAAEGALVYVCGTKIEKLRSVVDEICGKGLHAKPLLFNIMDEKSIEKAFCDVVDESGKIDLLVCCAGGGARDEMKPLVMQSTEVIDNVLNVNLRGGMLCTREACRHMLKNKSGNVVVISSTVGVRGMALYSEYAAAKAGLIAFVQSMAMELGKDGIRINCVTPGIVERGTIDELKLEKIYKTNWLNDYGKPEDIAAMVAYLNTDEASFITGQNFIVDGGRSLGLKNQG